MWYFINDFLEHLDFNKLTHQEIIDAMREIESISTEKYNVIFYFFAERYHLEQINQVISHTFQLHQEFNVNSMVFIFNEASPRPTIELSESVEVMYINSFCRNTYNHIKMLNNPTNDTWNPEPVALYLMGAPDRLHRIGLLHRFFKRKMLGNMLWSAPIPEEKYEELSKFIQDTDNQSFFREITVNLDVDTITGYVGFPYDVRLYKRTGLSVVSETECQEYVDDDTNHFTTEKIYRAMYNNHPFIVAGSHRYLNTLRLKGFKTFQEYLPIDYDNISNNHDRLDAVSTCVQFFIDSMKDQDFIEKIKQDVEHNSKLVRQLGKDIDDMLKLRFPGATFNY